MRRRKVGNGREGGHQLGKCGAAKVEGDQDHASLFLVLPIPVTHEALPLVNLRDLETSQLLSPKIS